MFLRIESFISGEIWNSSVKSKEAVPPTQMLAEFIQNRLLSATKVSVLHLDRNFGAYHGYPWEEITAIVCFEDPEKVESVHDQNR